MTAANTIPTAPVSVTVIRGDRPWWTIDLRELWEYRDLFWMWAQRDVRVRYKQAVLGAAWAVIQPVATMLVLSVVFGRLLGVAGTVGDAPYPVFLYAGLLPWTLLTAIVHGAGQSVVSEAAMLRKVYFPRVILPLSAAGAPLVDYAIATAVLLVLMLCYGIVPGVGLLLLPLLLIAVLLPALGAGMWLAALIARYRDFKYVIGLLLQLWFFLSPVVYPTSVWPQWVRPMVALNPMAGPIDAFRAVILGQSVSPGAVALSVGVGALMFATGLAYFQRNARRLADVV